MQNVLAALRGAFFWEVAEGQFRPRWRLIALTAVGVVLGVICVWLYVDYLQPPPRGAHLGKVMVLKCLNPQCGKIERYTLGQVREKIEGPPPADTVVLNCEQCGQKTLTQATECPQCGEVFVILLTRPGSDRCPNCGASYLSLLRQKQGQANQEQE